MTIQQIPLNQLVPSKANVRKMGADIGIAELAANIKALGLLQNLAVRPGEDGKFEVVAGRRRLLALKRLAKDKAIAKTEGIACNVLAEGEDPSEISLAENVMREPMHPADQYEAFKAMADNGKGPEDIAARFGCSAITVRQRLKLAAVSPALLDLYRAEEMTLDQLMAFTVSDDHAAQEKVWSELAAWNRHPSVIRRNLTQAHIEATDRLAVFVGIDTYLAAGGGIIRDLFEEAHEGYLTDPALLDRLVTERLTREADAVRGEGWKWVDTVAEFDYDALRRFRRVYPESEPRSEEQQAELDRLIEQYEALAAEHGDEPPAEIAAELESIEATIEALSQANTRWLPEDIALAGAIVGIGFGGRLSIERGLVRPEDMPAAEEPEERPRRSASTRTAPKRDKGELPAPLVEDLTAHKTATLRTVLARNPDIALVAVVHALALKLLYRYGAETCLAIDAGSADLRGSAEGIDDSPATVKLAARQALWRSELPEASEDLWDWLLARDMATRLDLLAYCAGCSVNAVVKQHERSDGRTLHADQLAAALALDMTQWWQPTAASYLGRVSKARILEAVTEGVSAAAAENLAKLKKDALAKLAEERLAGTGWLPAPLRTTKAPDTEPQAQPIAA